MKTGIRIFHMDEVMLQIAESAKDYDIEKLILFGSRARGDHNEKSDYDIAIFSSELDIYKETLLRLGIEDVKTLKKIDVVFIDEDTEKELLANIKEEGVILYEKTSN